MAGRSCTADRQLPRAARPSICARYGFKPLRDDGEVEFFTTVGRGGHVVVCHPNDVPEQTKARVAGITLDTRGLNQ